MEVEMFATMEEAMERLEEARKAADARLNAWQRDKQAVPEIAQMPHGLSSACVPASVERAGTDAGFVCSGSPVATPVSASAV